MAPDAPAASEQICSPCRGTGKLISGLGGTPHEVSCPWCRGSGRRIAGIDAQQEPAETAPAPAA
ncbi:MAG: hypothetical protein ACRDNJ_13565 [Solirubrobacteraceae bacterium]